MKNTPHVYVKNQKCIVIHYIYKCDLNTYLYKINIIGTYNIY